MPPAEPSGSGSESANQPSADEAPEGRKKPAAAGGRLTRRSIGSTRGLSAPIGCPRQRRYVGFGL